MADVNDMMEAYAQDAVDYAAHLKRVLDFSEKSIEQVEELCILLYNAIPRGFFKKLIRKAPSEETIIQMSKMLGGYVGEVLIKNYGGSWDIENFMNQGETIVLTIEDIKIFPVGKVYKRLKNGPEDNVAHFYSHMTRELKKSN